MKDAVFYGKLSIESESGNSEPWVLNSAQSATEAHAFLSHLQLFLFCTQLKSFTFVFIRPDTDRLRQS